MALAKSTAELKARAQSRQSSLRRGTSSEPMGDSLPPPRRLNNREASSAVIRGSVSPEGNNVDVAGARWTATPTLDPKELYRLADVIHQDVVSVHQHPGDDSLSATPTPHIEATAITAGQGTDTIVPAVAAVSPPPRDVPPDELRTVSERWPKAYTGSSLKSHDLGGSMHEPIVFTLGVPCAEISAMSAMSTVHERSGETQGTPETPTVVRPSPPPGASSLDSVLKDHLAESESGDMSTDDAMREALNRLQVTLEHAQPP